MQESSLQDKPVPVFPDTSAYVRTPGGGGVSGVAEEGCAFRDASHASHASHASWPRVVPERRRAPRGGRAAVARRSRGRDAGLTRDDASRVVGRVAREKRGGAVPHYSSGPATVSHRGARRLGVLVDWEQGEQAGSREKDETKQKDKKDKRQTTKTKKSCLDYRNNRPIRSQGGLGAGSGGRLQQGESARFAGAVFLSVQAYAAGPLTMHSKSWPRTGPAAFWASSCGHSYSAVPSVPPCPFLRLLPPAVRLCKMRQTTQQAAAAHSPWACAVLRCPLVAHLA